MHLAMSELKTQVTLQTANSCLGRAGNKDVGASLPSPALRPTPYPLILKGVGELAMLVPTGHSLIPYLALTRPRPAGLKPTTSCRHDDTVKVSPLRACSKPNLSKDDDA